MAPPEMQFVVEDSDAKLILAAAPYMQAAAQIAAATGAVVVDADSVATPATVARPVLGEGDRGAEHAVVGYTSGTTGFPKGALYSNDHYLTSAMRWGWEFGLTARDVMLDPGAVEAFCRERLAGYKVPRRVILADDLPRNPMGKVQKFRIIEGLTASG